MHWKFKNPPSILSHVPTLHCHIRLHISGGESVHIGEDEVFGAVATEGGLVLAADDGKVSST